MPLPKIKIREKEYPRPSVNLMKRKQVQQLKPALQRMQEEEDMEALWDVLGLMVPDLPKRVLDDLTVGECKRVIQDAGLAVFTGEDAVDEDGHDVEITVGESSASANS